MTRLRIWFALVALASLLGVGALVRRALAVADTERSLRHAAVAERVLDEMERSLSEWIALEEAGAGEPRDFVVARYELGPDGAARASDPARQRELENWLGAARRDRAAGPFAEFEQRAGTTQPISPPAAAPAEKPQAKSEAYEILSKLNRAGSERAKSQRRELALDEVVGGFADSREADAVRSALRARPLDSTHLALEQSVATGSATRRTGLVVDAPRLFAWLRGEILVGELVGVGRVEFAGPLAAELPEPDAEFVYRRRFAEPLDSLGAQLALASLPGVGTAGAIQALGAALAAVLLVGLGLAYRSVATVVGFAERRAQFAASVSHELKTPLTSIRMYAEMLRDGMVASPEKRDEYHRALALESDRLSRLVNNVLEFSQLEKGARRLALGVAPLEPALREALERIGPHAEREGFALRIEIAPNLPPARFERDALAQILFNLVDNAAKYARDAARREIEIRVEPSASGVAIRVRDHGPGVPPAQLGLVFEPFWRGESELTRNAKGTGIGLALVRRLAEAMGGRVRAANAAPTGFEVTLELV